MAGRQNWDDPNEHEPAAWLTWFADCCRQRATHPPRKAIIAQTRKVLQEKRYKSSSGGWVDLDDLLEKAPRGTVSRRAAGASAPAAGLAPGGGTARAVVSVVNMDCVQAAVALQKRLGRPVAMLNMGAPSGPGVGPQGAQEENLHRRSNLIQCTLGRRELYPIPDDGCLYHPDVVFFRGSEADGYPFLPVPDMVSVVTAAAVKGVFDAAAEKRTAQKIRAVLGAAAEFGHGAVVLSALGCGAFRNPPAVVARLFRAAVDAEFRAVFTHVVFAIIEDHNSGGVNGAAFAEAFDCSVLQNLEDGSV
ncbi:hypothetical protein DIPPA_32625 [Diplonema papillatum]|nr:hypothetical protein DIPPA_32625 [Diplonema papillatum]